MKPGRDQSGAALTEALAAMIILCLIFFGLLQIYRWASQAMVLEFAGYHAAEARAQGYSDPVIERTGRVAAIAASGRDYSRPPLAATLPRPFLTMRFHDYALYGSEPLGRLDFEYWTQRGPEAPVLRIRSSGGTMAAGRVWLERPGALHSALTLLTGGAGEIGGGAEVYNHSRHLLECP